MLNSSLESLLVFACLELEGNSRNVVVDAFAETMKIFMSDETLFEKLPETVIKTSEALRQQEENAGSFVGIAKDFVTNRGTDTEEFIEYFDDDALLIYDGIHASAFGRMSYIYRSKGIRFYLFKSGELNIITPYSHIDHSGFQLRNQICSTYGPDFENMSPDEVRSIIHFTSEDFNDFERKQFVCGELIKMLCSIKEKFVKDFYLEYLLTPPDVDKLSKFSIKNRKELWDICLSDKFRENWGDKIQYACMNILSSSNIPPSTGQIVKYIDSSKNSNATLSEILKKIDEIKENIVESNESNEIDIFELKPNIAGVGVNINELYKRARKRYFEKNRR